jgi:hypothetical protein
MTYTADAHIECGRRGVSQKDVMPLVLQTGIVEKGVYEVKVRLTGNSTGVQDLSLYTGRGI